MAILLLKCAIMAAYMPQRQYDLQQARETFAEVRKMPRKQQETAIASMKKQYALNIAPPLVGFGVPCQQAGDALELVAAFLDLYCEIKCIARADLNIRACVYYQQPASQADKRQWNIVKSKFAAAPYLMKMTALCLIGSEASELDNRLQPYRKRSLAGGVGYIQEPYWSDIVNILEHADLCPVRKFSGIIKAGEPPRYCWKATADLEIKGTTNPNQKGPVEQIGPCRNLECPTVSPTSLKKCSKCKQAVYCSVTCQKAHWKMVHKRRCTPIT